MSFVALAASALAFGLGAMFLLWLLSLRLRDASIVDIWGGPGFAAIALLAYALAERGNLLVTTLTALWGMRLGAYLLWRNAGHDEDRRHAAMRRQHGERFGRVSLGTVFAARGLIQWFVALPVLVAQANASAAPCAALSGVGRGISVIYLDSPGAIYTLASPLLMSFLLMRVSGVPLLEKSLAQRRAGYAEYQRRTSAFFPRPPHA